MPMLSLENAMNEDEMTAWYERLLRISVATRHSGGGFIVGPKIDSSAIELVYEKGVFKNGSTR